jgi:fructuronate reductase/mannitol 2-dehydrogenase
VVHVSVGAFHRAHQAVYFDDLARTGVTDWGVVGVGLRRPEMRRALRAQDGLYTVVERGAGADRARVVGVMCRYLLAPEERGLVLDALADPRTRLVTLTITGDGYADRRTDSAVAHLVEGLARRRRAGTPPFTVLSCDNIPENGEVARRAVLAAAATREGRCPGLTAWIDEHVAFPSSMVDRITPQTTVADRRALEREFGVRDQWPVVTEPFSQWIVEDRFSNERPPLERVGVRFVDDVRPYALMKTRLLNGSHCALGYLGCLAGHVRIDEAMRDPALASYVERLMLDEVAPLLEAVPGIDLRAYVAELLGRFANPRIGDRLARLARRGSTKLPTHVLSSIGEARAAGRPHPRLTLAVAAWCRYVRGVDERGEPLVIDDPQADRLRALALAGGGDPRPLLAEASIFGPLGRDPGFAAEVERALATLDAHGARAAAIGCGATEHHLVA